MCNQIFAACILHLFGLTVYYVPSLTTVSHPLLSALEAKGYLSSRLVPVAGRERKVYKATESGIDYLAHKKEKWYRWEEFANSILEL